MCTHVWVGACLMRGCCVITLLGIRSNLCWIHIVAPQPIGLKYIYKYKSEIWNQRGRVIHICVTGLDCHCFRKWLVTGSGPSHYLNQCCNIVKCTIWCKLNSSFIRNSNIFIQENDFDQRQTQQYILQVMIYVCLIFFQVRTNKERTTDQEYLDIFFMIHKVYNIDILS